MIELLIVTHIIAAVIEIGLPIFLIFYILKKLKTSVKLIFVGIAFFILVEIIRIPLLVFLTDFLAINEATPILFIILWLAFVSFTAGLFEEGARYLAYLWFMKKRNWKKALTYGIGHASIESILIGLLVSLSVINIILLTTVDLQTLNLTELQITELQELVEITQTTPWYLPLLGALERVMSISIHLGFSLLVMQAFVKKDKKYLLFAISLHTLLDFSTALSNTYANIFLAEGIVLLFGIFSYFYLIKRFTKKILK